MMDDDLIDLLAAWRGKDLDRPLAERLLARLREDDAFQQSFVDEIRLLGMLKAVQTAEPRWLALQEMLGWGAEDSAEDEDHEDDIMRRVLGADSPTRPVSRPRPWGPLAAAAVFAVVFTALIWPKTKREAPASADRPFAGDAAKSLAIVTDLESVQGEPSGGPPLSVGAVQSSGRFRIRSGRATLLFLNGVMLTLEGPADVDLVSIDTLFCRRGRLRVRIPKGVEGFVVISPRSVVVDRGAEFGLNVEDDGTSRVMVFEGTAEATLLDPSGVPKVTQLVDQGQEFEFDPGSGRVAEADAQPSRYIPFPKSDLPALRLAPAYPGAVLRSRPKGYWRFESLVDGRVPNEVSDGPRLWANGPVAFSGRAEGNGFALFPAGSPGQFLTTGTLWKLSSRPGYAVEFWFLAENFGRASLVGLFPAPEIFPAGHRSRYVHAFLVEATAYENRPLNRPGSVEFLRRWPLEADAGSSIFSKEICPPRRWHHVVAQKDGDRMDLFVDGDWAHSTNQESDHPDLYCRLVVGRRTIDPLNPMDSRSFVGRLDELAIYEHPLSDREIRHHFQSAAPSARAE